NAYETINLTMKSVAASEIGSQQVASAALAIGTTGAANTTYTISSGAEKAEVEIADDGASAKEVAAALNGAVPGVGATARTVVGFEFADIADPADAVSFTLEVGAVKVDFANITTSKELFRQLNENASALNIQVDEEAGTVTSSTGENLVFTGIGGDASGFMATTQGADGTPLAAAEAVDTDGTILSGSIQLDGTSGFTVV